MKNTQVIGAILVLTLASLIALGSVNVEQTVPISSLATIDSGVIVTITGILTDLWIQDSGIESLVVTDNEFEASARVVCTCGVMPMPSKHTSIGDEIGVTGEVSNDRLPPTIFTISDDVIVKRPSEEVLTMTLLASHWQLFIDDLVDVKGILFIDGFDTNVRLVALDGSSSLKVNCDDLDVAHLDRRLVTVTGTLRLDSSLMVLCIDAKDIRITAA